MNEKKLTIGVLAIAFGIGFAADAIKGDGDWLLVVILFFIGATLILLEVRKLRGIKPKTSPRSAAPTSSATPAAAPAAPAQIRRSYDFKTAGVTFSTDGRSRQAFLRQAYKDQERDGALPEVLLNETTYKNDPAIEVYADGFQVGFVPADKVQTVLNMLRKGYEVSRFGVVTAPDEDLLEEGEKKIYGFKFSLAEKIGK